MEYRERVNYRNGRDPRDILKMIYSRLRIEIFVLSIRNIGDRLLA